MAENTNKTCASSNMKISNETLRFTVNLTRVLFDSLMNAGELELAKMAYDILEKLDFEAALRGGMHMLISEKAVCPHFCPEFKAERGNRLNV
jgi:hypothetical protein